MVGGDERRFCSDCQKYVYNLSALSRSHARKIIAENAGRICVRFVRLPNGRIETRNVKLNQITRTSSIAAGVLTVAITLVSSAEAQSEQPQTYLSSNSVQFGPKKQTRTHQLTVHVTDATNSPIQGAIVEMKAVGSGTKVSALTNSEGIAAFERIPRGRFILRVTADHFKPVQRTVLVTQTIEPVIDVGLEIGTYTGVVAVDWYEIPLFDHIAQGDNKLVRQYLDSGFDISLTDSSGRTALHVATEHENLEIVRELLRRRADVNKRALDKKTPLLMLEDAFDDSESTHNALELIRMLISKGANINLQDREGTTVLMIAAESENLEAVRLLLEAGARVQVKDKDGETAFDKTDSNAIKQLLQKFASKK